MPESLSSALVYAIKIIESYQRDIRNSEWTGVDLVEKGFCQGSIYKEAVGDTLRRAGWTEDDRYYASLEAGRAGLL